MFEIKVVDMMTQTEDAAAKAKVSGLRQKLSVGFSTAGSSLFIGDSEDSIGFDSDGNFVSGTTKTKSSQKFGSGDVIAIVLNRDVTSPNANTISIFKNGK